MSVSVALRWVVVLLGVAQLQGESFWDVSDVIPPKEALTTLERRSRLPPGGHVASRMRLLWLTGS